MGETLADTAQNTWDINETTLSIMKMERKKEKKVHISEQKNVNFRLVDSEPSCKIKSDMKYLQCEI